ncbi:MAG: murein biosynthesis integral membrane protein MurJ, partial [Acidimicrobiales bacterium]
GGVLAAAGIAFAPALTTVVAPGFDPDTRRLTVSLVRLLFPMSGLMVVSAWCLGILNSHRRFFLPYAAPALWNVAGIAALVGAGTWLVAPDLAPHERMHRLALALAWGTVGGGVLQVAVQLPACARLLGGLRPRLSLAVEGVRDVLTAWMPLVLGAGVAQISGLVDTLLGSLAGSGSVASLSYAQLVQTLPISLFGVSVAAVSLPELARDAARTEPNDILRRRLAAAFRRVAFYVLPSAVACVGLGTVIVGALFQTGRFSADDTALVAGVLAAYGPGLVWFASVKLLASGFYALRDTRTPVKVSVASLAVSTALAVLLMRLYGAAGIALGSSLGAALQFVLLRARLDRRLGTVLDGAGWRLTGMAGLAALAALGAGVTAARWAAGLDP